MTPLWPSPSERSKVRLYCKTVLVFIIVTHVQTLSQQRPCDHDLDPWSSKMCVCVCVCLCVCLRRATTSWRIVGRRHRTRHHTESQATPLPDYFHRRPDRTSRASLRTHALPGYLYAWRTSSADSAHRGKNTGGAILTYFVNIIMSIFYRAVHIWYRTCTYYT